MSVCGGSAPGQEMWSLRCTHPAGRESRDSGQLSLPLRGLWATHPGHITTGGSSCLSASIRGSACRSAAHQATSNMAASRTPMYLSLSQQICLGSSDSCPFESGRRAYCPGMCFVQLWLYFFLNNYRLSTGIYHRPQTLSSFPRLTYSEVSLIQTQ